MGSLNLDVDTARGAGSGSWTGRRMFGAARAGLLVLIAFVAVSWLLSGIPSTAQGARERTAKDPDYPELFQTVAVVLKQAYLDLDRVNPRALMDRAFAALENAVDEIYVDGSEATRPYVAVHLESKVQVFNLDHVKSLDDAVRMLENVFLFIKANYRGDEELNEIRYAAINGFLSGLDPHTLVFSPKAFKDFSVHIEGEIYGVGMYVGSRDGKLVVLEVLKDTPAHRAGFKKGDLIAKVGDESTINMTVTEAVDKIRGTLKSWVTLTVKRARADDPDTLEALDIPVQRDRVVIKSVESKLIEGRAGDDAGRDAARGGIGYVKIINFDKNTTNGLREHMEKLAAENGRPLSGLILDFRGNSGGLLTQAVEMSDLFLKSGTIVIQAARNSRFHYQEAQKDGNEPTYPIVVLADESSASGAEIVVGALQKNNRALVLGSRTFGKGSVQQLHRLPNEAQLKITVSEYLLPEKISIQENGVTPDIYGKPVILDEEEGFDLFPNERSMTEKDYDQHIVSRYAKKEVPSYTIEYALDTEKVDLDNDPFMSGDLRPEKDKLVEMALAVLDLAAVPYDPKRLLEEKGADILALKGRFFDEIVAGLREKGIDWSFDGASGGKVRASDLDLELSSRFLEEPSGDEDDPIPVHKLEVTARLTNRGEGPVQRIKGLSRSDYMPYKDQEFLFGRVGPAETVERSVKIRLPQFPYARNDLFTVEVSTMPETPGWDVPEDVIFSRSLGISQIDRGRPSFAYSATLLDAAGPRPIRSLSTGLDGLLRVTIRNTGNAPVYKGIAILRNETGRQVFLKKGRIEFPAIEEEKTGVSGVLLPAPAGDYAPTSTTAIVSARAEDPSGVEAAPSDAETPPGEEADAGGVPRLGPGETTDVEFAFEIRAGDPVDAYDFELAIIDPYSQASLVRRLSIPRRDKEDARPFPNGIEFALPEISVALKHSDGPAPGSFLVTSDASLRLKALVNTRAETPFKAWVFNSFVGERDLPDKIYFADSQGNSSLAIETPVSLRKGTNFFTVVVRDRNDLETRQSIFVRRE